MPAEITLKSGEKVKVDAQYPTVTRHATNASGEGNSPFIEADKFDDNVRITFNINAIESIEEIK